MKSIGFKSVFVVSLAVVLGFSSFALSGAGTQKDYKVGDRLPKTAPVPVKPSEPYRKLNWDELMPADWDPMKALKGIDLSKMEDSDPRAMDALQTVRESWNNAPIEPKLDGARIEIPGFVVPLDVDSKSVKEFLLVPYFGACIHVPPPPSNQVLHVLTPKTLTKEQQKALKNAALTSGAISVSGTLETAPIRTAMGFASYRLKADRVDPYKAPETK
jgi:hypothetical protein